MLFPNAALQRPNERKQWRRLRLGWGASAPSAPSLRLPFSSHPNVRGTMPKRCHGAVASTLLVNACRCHHHKLENSWACPRACQTAIRPNPPTQEQAGAVCAPGLISMLKQLWAFTPVSGAARPPPTPRTPRIRPLHFVSLRISSRDSPVIDECAL
jgi:hypothetical protein